MFNSSLYILQHNYNCKIDNKLCKICEWSNDETSMKNVLNAKEKIALLTKITLSSSHFFQTKRRWTICLIFFFSFKNNSLSFQLPLRPTKADLSQKLDFEAKLHIICDLVCLFHSSVATSLPPQQPAPSWTSFNQTLYKESAW